MPELNAAKTKEEKHAPTNGSEAKDPYKNQEQVTKKGQKHKCDCSHLHKVHKVILL